MFKGLEDLCFISFLESSMIFLNVTTIRHKHYNLEKSCMSVKERGQILNVGVGERKESSSSFLRSYKETD